MQRAILKIKTNQSGKTGNIVWRNIQILQMRTGSPQAKRQSAKRRTQRAFGIAPALDAKALASLLAGKPSTAAKKLKSRKPLKIKAFSVIYGAPEGIRIPDLPLRSGKKRSPLMPLATLGVPCFTGFLTFPSVHISVQIPRFSPGEISRVLAQLIFLWGQKTSRIHYQQNKRLCLLLIQNH